jgi:hypothetical protein
MIMKKIMVAFSALFILAAAHAQTATTPATSSQTTAQDVDKVVQVSDVDHDMGKIAFGKPVEYTITIKNLSKDTIKTITAQAGCGCTTPQWENSKSTVEGPFAPGQTYRLKLGFNGGTKGSFTKVVTLHLDNGLSKQLRFHGETFETPADAAPANSATSGMKPPATN